MISYDSPFFVDMVLYAIYVLLALAVGLTGWSVVRGLRLQGRDGGVEHGVPARRIALLTAALLLLTLAATWLLGSDRPLSINGRTYADAFWLKTSDMLLMTPVVLMAVLAIAMVAGLIRRR